MGGAFGSGIDLNIEQLYTFLVLNYEDGDEIFLFGYSRGAYTVRSLAGLIHEAGLVRRRHMLRIGEAYEMYRNLDVGADSEKAVRFRREYGERVPIECIVCLDTVGALGIPESVSWLSALNRNRYEFHDTTLSAGIKKAIHALSIDESRSVRTPTRMTAHPSAPSQVTEKFFWGSHGGVGGSEYTEPETIAVVLRFVLDELQALGFTLTIAADHPGVPKDYPDTAVERKLIAGLTRADAVVNAMTGGQYTRKIESVDQVHFTAVERFQKIPTWRPKALEKLEKELVAVDVEELKEKHRLRLKDRA